MNRLCFILLCFFASRIIADQSITLSWDRNPEPDVAGYVVYYGLNSRLYPNATNVGNATTATIRGLMEDQPYYFAVTAISTSGLESEFSNEVTNAIPHVIEYITLLVQESVLNALEWTNIWSIDRAVNSTNYIYRVRVQLPPYTNQVPSSNDFQPIIDDLPPLPTVAP